MTNTSETAKEHLFDAFIAALDHKKPHHKRRYGHTRHTRDAEQFHAARDAGKLAERRCHIADEQRAHGKRGKTYAETFANKSGEPLARHRAHASGRHLDDHKQGRT